MPVDARVRLPREAWTVTLARHLVRAIVADQRVNAANRGAVEVAISEARANAVRHANPSVGRDISHHARCVE
jgi:anti-sigma regulatory factor (Ser/Thr protein kinase)